MLIFLIFMKITRKYHKGKKVLNQLYSKLPSTSIHYEYSSFSDFHISEPQDIKRTNQSILSGDYFPYATVDTNYITLNNIKVFDKDHNEVVLDHLMQELFRISTRICSILFSVYEILSKRVKS